VKFIWRGLRQGWHLVITGNPYIRHVTWVTIEVAILSTAIALLIGLPLGLGLGLGRFRGRQFGLILANFGLVLPPVMVGLVLSLLMFPEAPLGRFHLLFTLRGVYIAQTVLAVPIVVSRLQVWGLALRESRIGILTAIIATVGSALSEVGAVVLVGGNIVGDDQTLASATIQAVDAGDFAGAMAIGIILLGFILVITAALTFIQQRSGVAVQFRASS